MIPLVVDLVFSIIYLCFCVCVWWGGVVFRDEKVEDTGEEEKREWGWGGVNLQYFYGVTSLILGNAEDTVGSYGTLSNANILHAKGGNRTPPWKVEI